MRKLLTFVPAFLCVFLLHAQADTSGWTELWSVTLDAEATWDVDQAGNTYLVNQQTIRKLDTLGKAVLTQSSKAIGRISKIDASNWLKIALFSEDQQLICYLDNALGIQPGCIELGELGINLAQQFATSSQTDRLWIYDQLNSELQLLTIRTSQHQIVQNLKSLAETGNTIQLTEFGNSLYLLDDKGLLITFDNFGSFTGSEQLTASWIQPFNNGLLTANGNSIWSHNDARTQTLPFFTLLANQQITRFYYTAKRLYISTGDKLICLRHHT